MIRFSWALGLVLAGCGLVSSDVSTVKLALPSHDFRVDTADWHLVASGMVPALPCSADCAAVSSQICSAGSCSVDCNQDTQTCQGHVSVSLVNDYDLAKEAPEFQRFAGQSAVSVTIDEVWFQIAENTLNVPTPELAVYLGPMSASKPGDAGVVLVGTLPPVAVAMTGKISLMFASGGMAAVKKFMDDYKTPFRVIVAGTVLVKAGDPVPQGRVVGAVNATAHVSL